MRWSLLARSYWFFVLLLTLVVAGFASAEYQGSVWVYMLFTVLSSALLFFGFGRGAIFFDTFIGVLLWIGFWLKFSVRTAFLGGDFPVPVGAFDGSPRASDEVLMVASCAFCALLLVRFLRARLFTYPEELPTNAYPGLFSLYMRFRWLVLSGFLVLVVLVGGSNAWFGLYQRGLEPRAVLPFGLNGVYAWLLTFGLAAISAVILRFEFERSRDHMWLGATLALLEGFVSSVSLMSRGMILNAGALCYGGAAMFRRVERKLRLGLLMYVGIVFCVLFAGSVLAVNTLRAHAFDYEARGETVAGQTALLFLDRWVGIEGLMSVVAKEDLGWDLFGQALSERLDTSVTSFYDQHFVDSYHANAENDGLHFISLPGYIAFLFYPGSYWFLFLAVSAFSVAAGGIEYLVYRFGGRNLILCALLAQVVAYRYTSFGYVPMQSYKLFGTVLLTVLLFFLADKLVARLGGKLYER